MPNYDDRAYDDYSYMKLCSMGHVHILVRLMEVEERYGLRGADCINYRCALDAAATSGGSIAPSKGYRHRIPTGGIALPDGCSG